MCIYIEKVPVSSLYVHDTKNVAASTLSILYSNCFTKSFFIY